MVKYKLNYLGDQKHVFGFVKKSLAQKVRENLNCENFKVAEVNPNHFKINQSSHLIKPLHKRALTVEYFDLPVGIYFSSVNNTKLVMIDEVDVDAKKDIKLISNFIINYGIDMEDIIKHLDVLYEKKKDQIINYECIDLEED